MARSFGGVRVTELEKAIRDSGLLISGLQETGRTLGKGSYGEVIEVRVNGRLCAAKKLHGIFNAQDVPPAEKASMAERFERECRRVLQLKHPNIVEMVGVRFDRTTQQPTLVMELLDTSLCSYLEDNPVASVTTATKYSILLDVATGLVYLHTLPPPLGPIVHRDLTASNILLALGEKMVAKIADLGQAKNDPAYTAQRQKMSQVPGNEDHMPPEAWLDEPTYNTSLDIFSFGVVILHTLVHEWPKPLGRLVSATEVRLEVERRKSYLDQIDGSLLKPLVIECLGQKPEERPVASAVLSILKMGKHCFSKMASLREAHKTEIATLNQQMQIQVNQLQAAAAEDKRHIDSLQQEVNQFRVAAAQDKEHIESLQQKVDQLAIQDTQSTGAAMYERFHSKSHDEASAAVMRLQASDGSEDQTYANLPLKAASHEQFHAPQYFIPSHEGTLTYMNASHHHPSTSSPQMHSQAGNLVTPTQQSTHSIYPPPSTQYQLGPGPAVSQYQSDPRPAVSQYQLGPGPAGGGRDGTQASNPTHYQNYPQTEIESITHQTGADRLSHSENVDPAARATVKIWTEQSLNETNDSINPDTLPPPIMDFSHVGSTPVTPYSERLESGLMISGIVDARSGGDGLILLPPSESGPLGLQISESGDHSPKVAYNPSITKSYGEHSTTYDRKFSSGSESDHLYSSGPVKPAHKYQRSSS